MSYEETKAIVVQQPFGDFYIVSIPASKLVKVVHSIPAEYTDGQLDGVQRAVNNKRIEDISRFCLTEKPLFPNTIILAANMKDDGDLVEDEQQWFVDDGVLVIPSDMKAASIVDGQHRIEGMKKALAQGMDDFDLVCAIYMDLPTAKQAEVFATINFNQQKVDKSLAYQLFGYDLETTEPEYWSPDTLAISITRILGKQRSSPFKNHIGFGTKESELVFDDEVEKQRFEEDPWKISTSTMVAGISSLISKNSVRDRYSLHKKRFFKKDRTVLDLGSKPIPPLRSLYLEFEDETIYLIVEGFFLSVDSNFWGNSETLLRKTIGIQALFDILNILLKEQGLPNKNVVRDQGFKEHFDRVLSKANVAEIDVLEKNYSGSGRVAIRNELRKQIGV
ncbi:hypothetical protein AWH63_11210 [Marinobacter sp. C18]|jgi:DNA phosphorothioation-associated DGQHR protein 1|uniref:DGQHR domain-containing protein n=1 Tax=Marinobacter sp. C18 TaxID=1772288 RepID=UPI0009489287|nr:DGQHR domain-containing protein [Marinobacter sp. C18]OLF81669.1 hypothetical protein AWH63_11210 [Marinobacter sp. C18]